MIFLYLYAISQLENYFKKKVRDADMCGLRVTLVPEVFLASSRLWFSHLMQGLKIKKILCDRGT